MILFLRETLWILYALYFVPAQLEQQLRATIAPNETSSIGVNLYSITGYLTQGKARRYLAQITLLCILALTPFLLMNPKNTEWSWEGGVTALVILIAAVGLATYSPRLGISYAVFQSSLLARQLQPFEWLHVLSTDPSTQKPLLNWSDVQAEVWLDWLMNPAIGFAIGLSVGLIGRSGILPQKVANVIGIILVFAAGCRPVYDLAGSGVVGVASLIAVFIVIAEEHPVWKSIAWAMTYMTVLGIGSLMGAGTVLVLAFGFTNGIAGLATIVPALTLGILVLLGAGSFFASFQEDDMRVILLAFTIAGFVAVSAGAILAVSLFYTANEDMRLWLIGVLGFVIGSAFVPDEGLDLSHDLFQCGLCACIGFAFWSSWPFMLSWWLGGMVGLMSLPTTIAYVFAKTLMYTKSGQGQVLKPNVAQFALDPPKAVGIVVLQKMSGVWRQSKIAQQISVRLICSTLDAVDSKQAIADYHRLFIWLPGHLPPTVASIAEALYDVSTLVDERMTSTKPYARLVRLRQIEAKFDQARKQLAVASQNERDRVLPIVNQWFAILFD